MKVQKPTSLQCQTAYVSEGDVLALRRFTGAINRINSHVQGFVEAHGRGRLRFLDCRSFLLSETEDIDEELMPDSAYLNAAGE